jgi:threonine/homoserine/homoserine lactone efflux protein
MRQVIGDILPVALGVAISPVPIIAVILMLLAPKAKAASIAFMLGWVLGIAVVVVAVTLLVDPVGQADDGGPSTFSSVAMMLLGVAAVLLAARQCRSRPHEGEEPTLPKWMAAIDSITAGKAFGLGILLSSVNPKNLTLCLAGGVTIGGAGLSGEETVVAIAVFVLIGASTVMVPVLAYLAARARMQAPLDRLRVWLTANNATVMSVLLLVIGVAIFGKGLAGL